MQGEEGNSEAQENEWIKRGWRNNVKRGRDGGTNGRGPVSTHLISRQLFNQGCAYT